MQNAAVRRRIQIDLRKLAFDHDASISTISRKTGISRTTLTALYKNSSSSISFDVLEKLCAYFNCQVKDIIKFQAPDIRTEIGDGGRYE